MPRGFEPRLRENNNAMTKKMKDNEKVNKFTEHHTENYIKSFNKLQK